MSDDMSSAFEEDDFPQLTNGYYLRPHIVAFLFLIPVFILAAYRGPVSFSVEDVMGFWGAAVMAHALWTFLHSGLYEWRREDTIERMIDREMRSTSLSERDQILMTKVLDYDIRKAAKPLLPLLHAAAVSGFLSLSLWFISEIVILQGGPNYVSNAQFAYIGFVLAVSYYYRSELFFTPIWRGLAKTKRFIHRDTTPSESKLKRALEIKSADNSEYEFGVEEGIQQRLSK